MKRLYWRCFSFPSIPHSLFKESIHHYAQLKRGSSTNHSHSYLTTTDQISGGHLSQAGSVRFSSIGIRNLRDWVILPWRTNLEIDRDLGSKTTFWSSRDGASKWVNREAGLQKEEWSSLAERSRQDAVQSTKEKQRWWEKPAVIV